MENFKKIVRLGSHKESGSIAVFCTIKFKDGRLSITGVEGPKSNGDCMGGCGQIDDNLQEVKFYAEGWSKAKVSILQHFWRKWHLNDMRAGSPMQEAFLELREMGLEATEGQRWEYTTIKKALEEAGLQPDPFHLVNGQPYSYGSAWLTEEVPAYVLEWLKALPDSDRAHPWKE